MNIIEVMRLPLSVDLSGFIHMLQRLQVPHRVSEEGDVQVLWAPDTLAEDVRELYQRYPQGNAELPAAPEPVAAGMSAKVPSLAEQARACKVTPLAETLDQGQWWRLVSPMLLHFGVLHLAMNSLWYWELGKRIELRQGPWMLLGLTLLYSLVSNLAQHYTSGPSLFGGLSGVLYGLLGHVWLFQWLAPNRYFNLPKGVLVMMLIWLVVCLTGVVGSLGLGQIANAAHVGGLLIGCLTGLLGGALARRKPSA